MVEKVTKIRIFLGSPRDLNYERDAFPNIIQRLNKAIDGLKGIVLEPVMWETDTWPGFGLDAQEVIDEQIGTYDIFIGIMWKALIHFS